MKHNKKGLSPVIASVLIILLVITLFSIIFSWARGFLEEQTEETSALSTKLCPAVEFLVMNISVIGSETLLQLVNRGNVDIGSFDFKTSYSDGSAETVNLGVSVLIGGAAEGRMNFSSGVEEIEVFAVLETGSKSVVCDKKSVLLAI